MVGIVISFLVGTLVGITGAVVSNFFIWPMRRQLIEIGEIADSLAFYEHIYRMPELYLEKIDEVELRFRTHATRLLSFTVTIPWYWLLEILKLVRKRQHIAKAHEALMSISAKLADAQISYKDTEEVIKLVDEIRDVLRIRL